MERKDLRKNIISTKIENTDENQRIGNKDFNTLDFIFVDSYDEQYNSNVTDEERKVSSTDYAVMNNLYINHDYKKNQSTTWSLLRYALNKASIQCLGIDGRPGMVSTITRNIGICPSLRYKIDKINYDIREKKNSSGKILYHTLQIGEYVGTKVEKVLSQKLELLYNAGNLREGLYSTGRWYTGNGQKEDNKEFLGKHSPEFEYEGKKYVRVIANPNRGYSLYSDGTVADKNRPVKWVKVEPISWIIKNWDEMPKNINPEGSGKAKCFELRTEKAIISNIPFYPNVADLTGSLWQNSTIRGFLNGIDVRNITENGNPKFGASNGGSFKGECNFLNEAFNLSREPICKYAISESETEIPDDAFNGCISLKKLVIHSNITKIGERAFEGIDFKYAYILKTGEIVLGQELLKDQKNCELVIDIRKISSSLEGFDYNVLLDLEKIKSLLKLSDKLSRNKFSIPYIYAEELYNSGNINILCENSDFRFF